QHAVVAGGRHVHGLVADAPARDVLEGVGPLEDGVGVALVRGGNDGVVALDQLDHLLVVGPTALPAVRLDVPAGLAERLQSRIVVAARARRGDQYLRHRRALLQYARRWSQTSGFKRPAGCSPLEPSRMLSAAIAVIAALVSTVTPATWAVSTTFG